MSWFHDLFINEVKGALKSGGGSNPELEESISNLNDRIDTGEKAIVALNDKVNSIVDGNNTEY